MTKLIETTEINIQKEIDKIEKFIKVNFARIQKDSINEKRLIKYTYYLEKIKSRYSINNVEISKNVEKSIINDILDLKEMIRSNNK